MVMLSFQIVKNQGSIMKKMKPIFVEYKDIWHGGISTAIYLLMTNKFGHEEVSRREGNVSVPQSDGFHIVRGGRGDRGLFAPLRSSKSLEYQSSSFVGRWRSTPNLRSERVLCCSAEASWSSENTAVLSFGTRTVG